MNEQALTAILRKLGIHEFKRQRSGWLDFHCPLAPYTHRSGTDRSMSAGVKISPTGVSAWVCHACKHHGRVSSLVLKVQRFTGHMVPGLLREAEMAEVLPDLSSDYGEFERPPVTEQEPLSDAVCDGLYPPANDIPEAVAYLDRRGIDRVTADSLGLVYDDGQSRILFPVRDRNHGLWGFSGRAILPETKPKIRDYFGLPKRRLILGEERWRPDRPVIVVEGLFGYAHLVQIGAEQRYNVGALLGSAMTPEKAAILRAWDENVYLLLDNDEAGDLGLFGPVLPDGSREQEKSAVHQLQGYVPVYVPVWPDGKDDPDQLTLEELHTLVSETALYSS